jgi:hypothetical protein
MFRRLVAPLAICVLAGCAAVNTIPSLDPVTAPDPKLGYVAGSFYVVGKESRFAFQIASEHGSVFHFGFGEPREHGYETRMIPLPPGVYHVESWVTYSTTGAEQKRQKMSDTLGVSFVVLPGHVVYLGQFSASTEVKVTMVTYRLKSIRTNWAIQPDRIRADEVAAVIPEAFPKFAAAPVECLLCTAPQAGAASFARPALTPDAAAAKGIAVP